MPNIAKTKASQKRLDAAVAAFHARYSSMNQYGEQRWTESLYPALSKSTEYTALLNGFVSRDDVDRIFGEAGLSGDELREVEFPGFLEGSSGVSIRCYKRVRSSGADDAEDVTDGDQTSTTALLFPTPARCTNQLLSHWNMDAASVLAACMLRVQPGDRVLDLCAAPGGKSVVLAQYLWPQRGGSTTGNHITEHDRSCLHANEPDTNRNKRLLSNLESYIPAQYFESKQVKVFKADAAASKTVLSSFPFGTGHDSERYDKILVDAPCSSERHIVHAYVKATSSGQISEEILNWKASHSITLAKTQLGLLTTALKAVRTGGRVVYATCALGVEENDGVVERALEIVKKERKKEKMNGVKSTEWAWDVEFEMGTEGAGVDLDDHVLNTMTEQTKYGRIALPDRGGCGPLYFSVMIKVVRKIPEKKDETVAAKSTSPKHLHDFT